MRIGEIIREYRSKNELSVRDFAKLTGISRGYISQIENDIENKRSLTLQKIGQIAKGLGMTSDELLEMMDDTKVDLVPKKTSNNVVAVTNLCRSTSIPIYSALSCGTGTWVDEMPEDYVTVPESMMFHGKAFANFAEGDSMEPKIRNGDLLIFQETPVVPSGSVGSFSLNDAYYCKRFKQLADGSCWLFSDNPEYDPIPIKPNDDFRTLGIYKLKLSKEQ